LIGMVFFARFDRDGGADGVDSCLTAQERHRADRRQNFPTTVLS